jgi:copper chaperone CopZ
MEKKEYKINGLHCQHCVMRVKQALEHVPGIDNVEVSQEDELLRVFGQPQPDVDTINEALEKAGHYSISES